VIQTSEEWDEVRGPWEVAIPDGVCLVQLADWQTLLSADGTVYWLERAWWDEAGRRVSKRAVVESPWLSHWSKGLGRPGWISRSYGSFQVDEDGLAAGCYGGAWDLDVEEVCWASDGSELPTGVTYSQVIGAGKTGLLLALRSDGVIAWIDPVKAETKAHGWLTEVAPPAGARFTKIVAAEEKVGAVDSTGGAWSATPNSPQGGTAVLPHAEGTQFMDVGALWSELVFVRSDGVVARTDDYGDPDYDSVSASFPRPVRVSGGAYGQVWLTEDGGAIPWGNDLLYEDGVDEVEDVIVPPVGTGWRFVDAVTALDWGVFALVRDD
jgi:hypothetical protein